MNLSFGQIILLIFLALLLFGNLPNVVKDLIKASKTLHESWKTPSDKKSSRKKISRKKY